MENIIECPVCGMELPQTQAEAAAVHDAQTYHFCSVGCRDAFVADPGRYVGNTGS
ncbi:MAG: YHS domain-containing protein [Propionicimonas sp.]